MEILHDALLIHSAIATRLPAFRVSWSLPGVIKEPGDDYWMSTSTKWMEKMSKKYESANISDVEEHISLKYDIKKRLGKGVSNFFSLFNLVEMNLFAQAVQLLTKLQVAVWANRKKKTVSLQSSFSFAVSNSSAFMCSNSVKVSSALKPLNSWNSPDLQFSVDTSVLSKRFIYFGSKKINSFFADQLVCEDTCSL